MVNIYGGESNLGFGIHCKNMIRSLQILGEEVVFLPIKGSVQPPNDLYYQSFIDKAKDLTKFKATNPSLFIFHEEESCRYTGSPAFAFSIFETDQITPIAKAMLNSRASDVILVTTKEHKKILENSNIITPIEILHEGVNEDIFNLNTQNKLINTNKFTFITAGKKEKRKNTDKIIRAFVDICQYKEIALICHTKNPFTFGPNINVRAWSDVDITKFGFNLVSNDKIALKFSNGVCDIYFTHNDIETKDLPLLYNSANVGIQCSSGESWGLPEVEMMACGIPLIITDTIGHREYLSAIPEELKSLIITPTESEIANDNFWFKGNKGKWMVVDISDIRTKINEVISNMNNFKNKNITLSNNLIQDFSWNKAAQSFLDLIKKYKM